MYTFSEFLYISRWICIFFICERRAFYEYAQETSGLISYKKRRNELRYYEQEMHRKPTVS